MLTQLNSVYYELALAFTKATTPLENKYKKNKYWVFLKLSHFGSSWLDGRSREREYYNQ